MCVWWRVCDKRGAGESWVFPPTLKWAGERWFLRTPVNPNNSRDLVFIGINPSSATRFSTQKLGGDPTTEMILKYFCLNAEGAARDWCSMSYPQFGSFYRAARRLTRLGAVLVIKKS